MSPTPKPTNSPKRLTLPQLKQAMLDKAATSALKPAQVREMGLEPVADVSKLPGMERFPARGGFRIPYFDLKGNLRPKVCRVRYLEETRTGFQLAVDAKALRYVQAPGTTVHAYLPPFIDWAAVAKDPIYDITVTEGELKAACVSAHGESCIGLGGVWSWKSNAQHTTLIDDLRAINWSGRTVYICFDSDAVFNPDVMAAEVALADRLTAEGALVHIMRIGAPFGAESEAYDPTLPTDAQPRARRPKLGADDLIYQYGFEAFEACRKLINVEEGMERVGTYAYDSSRAFHAFNAQYIFILSLGAIYDVKTRLMYAAHTFQNSVRANEYYEGAVLTKPKKEGAQPETRMVRKPLAPAWIKWPGRATVERVIFEPGKPMVHTASFNTWQGWGYGKPQKGDITLWKRLLDRIFRGAPASDRKWFEQWVAYPLQHPGAKLATGVLIWGHQHGTGKSLLGKVISKMYHREHVGFLTESAFDDARNQWAKDKQFMIVDDITGRESREYANRLKNLITQESIHLDPKFIGAYDIRDVMNYLMTANDPDALRLDPNDRRMFVHGVQGSDRTDTDFAGEVMAWVESEEGNAALAHHLLTLDLEGFRPGAPAPYTDAKHAMVETTSSDLANWVRHLHEFPELVLDAARFNGDLYTAEKLYALYDPSGDKKSSPRVLTRELQSRGFQRAAASGLVIPGEGRRHVYILRNFDQWAGRPTKDLVAEYLRGNPQLASKNKKY